MNPIINIHAHQPAPDAILSLEPAQFNPSPGQNYSVAIHPWNTGNVTQADIDLLRQAAQHPQVVAIGETGLDRLRGADITTQRHILQTHIQLAEQLRKPLIIHLVRATAELLDELRQTTITTPVVIHGFRGKPAVANQLIKAGCLLSFGERFNPESLAIAFPGHFLLETDTSTLTISQIAQRVADTLQLPPDTVLRAAADNAARVLSYGGFCTG